jgi:hypothetical protein
MIGQSEAGAAVISYFLHSSLAGVMLCYAFLPASENCAKMLGQNHFAEPNQHVLSFVHPILICRVTY